MAAAAQVPPQNIEMEESVLGAMMVAEPVLDRVINEVALERDDFYLDRHRDIFEAITQLFAAGKPVDELTVAQKLEDLKLIEGAGGKHYVSELAAKVPAAGNAKHYAEEVQKMAQLRRMIAAGQELQEAGYDGTANIDEALASAEDAILNTFEHRRSGARHIIQGLNEVIDRQEKLASGDEEVTGVKTGFSDLDAVLGTIRPGNVAIVAARPSMGKSSLAMNIAENVALDQGKAVLIQSLEMSEEEVIERMLSSQTEVPLSNFRFGNLSARHWPKILKACNNFERSPIYIDDSAGLTITEISTRARTLQRRLESAGGLALMVVDYLQLLRSNNSRMSEYEKITDASIALKKLAKDLDIPILAVSQLSRQVEQRPDKRPQLSDIRQSGQIEQDADVVMLLYRAEYYDKETDEPGVAEVNVAKHRNGPLGTKKLTWRDRYTAFRNHTDDTFATQVRGIDEAA